MNTQHTKIILTEEQMAFLDKLLNPTFGKNMPDGVWKMICAELISNSGRFPGLSTYEVWNAWLEQYGKITVEKPGDRWTEEDALGEGTGE